MDLTKLLKNVNTARDCELAFAVLSVIGLLCVAFVCLAALFETNVNAPKAVVVPVGLLR